MKVSLVQMDIVWGDVKANLDYLDAVLAKAERADVYVLPEMFTTGFATLPGSTVESGDPCEGLAWMKSKAAELGSALAGSIALMQPDGKCVNRFHFVKPDGEVVVYDKRHLFGYGGECERFRGGEERVVVEYKGWRFLLAVCYDLRFPVWLRSRRDYDAMIVVASWPDKRRYAWDTLVRARAIENQCYVLAVNRVGTDPACVYDGGTVLLDPYGEEISRVADNTQGCASGELDLAVLDDYRSKFPVLADADDFDIR